MMDLDGTTIPNKVDGLPSQKVKKAVQMATKIIHVGVATARPMFLLHDILDALPLEGPSIITGGSQIIQCPTRKIVWEKSIEVNDLKKINDLCNELGISYSTDYSLAPADVTNSNPESLFQLYFGRLQAHEVERITTVFSSVHTVALHKIPSWKEGTIDLVVTHALATKQHGILEVAKILGIETHEMIGIGDGYNDFPLLMACGLKVAMGNAVPDLKEIADYIAPTVEEDGVADVIEKFIL